MVLVIFFGGIFLGFALGFATMALLAARDNRRQCEECERPEAPIGHYTRPKAICALFDCKPAASHINLGGPSGG